MKRSILSISILALTTVIMFSGCDMNDPNEHHDEYSMEFSYSPDPATVNTEIVFTFKIEDDHGEHIEGLMHTEGEFEMDGMDPVEIELTEDSSDPGHYIGTATFTMAGNYEVQFHYIHDGESNHITSNTTLTVQ